MTDLDPAEDALLRTRPHRSKYHLSIYQPDTLLAARVNNGSIAQADRTIAYDNAVGDFNDVESGMTMYVGTTEGGDELGRIRVRSITSNQVVVAENAIDWADDAYLTIIKYFEPWAIYPRIVLDDDNNPTFYKDYDIAYTDQNDILDPVPMMGPNLAGMLDAISGEVSFYFDASESYDLTVGGSVSSYAWEFEGGTPSSSAVADPGNVVWDTPGHYMVKLTVTNNNGRTFSGYRFVSVYTQPGGANPPVRNWGADNLVGDYGQGHWSTEIWMRQDADFSVVRPGALIVIFSEDWYGSTKSSLGGNYPEREDIVFVGYVRDGSVSVDPVTSVVRFTVTGICGRLAMSEVFGVSIESVTDAETWYQIREMTVDRAIYHYLRWQSTVYMVTDVRPNGDTLAVEYADFARSPLYAALDQFLSSTLFGHVVSDRQGQIWMEKKTDIVEVGDRTLATTIALTDADWMNEIQIQQRRETPISYAELGGIRFDGPGAGTFQALISIAPHEAPLYEGSMMVLNGAVLEDQTVTNQLVGNILANVNKEFPSVTIPLSGNYRVFDIAPQERTLLTLTSDQNELGLVWDNKSFIPRRVSIRHIREQETALVELELEEESDGIPGIPGPYPNEAPDDPPTNPSPIPPPIIPGTPVLRSIVVLDEIEGIFLADQLFEEEYPVWFDINGTLTAQVKADIFQIAVDQASGFRLFAITPDEVWRLEDMYAESLNWELIYTAAQAATAAGSSYEWKIMGIACDPGFAGGMAFTAAPITCSVVPPDFNKTSDPARVFYTTDGGNNIQMGSYINTSSPARTQAMFLGGDCLLSNYSVSMSFGPSLGRLAIAYHGASTNAPELGGCVSGFGGENIAYFTGFGATKVGSTGWENGLESGECFAPLYIARGGYGQRMMISSGIGVVLNLIGVSTDNGVTRSITSPSQITYNYNASPRLVRKFFGLDRSGNPGLILMPTDSQFRRKATLTAAGSLLSSPMTSPRCVINTVDNYQRWVMAGNEVLVTENFGTTWYDKTGELADFGFTIDLIDIDIVLAVE